MKTRSGIATFTTGFVLLFSAYAFAQVDPASSLLVTGSKDENTKPNLDSGRYTVRPAAPQNTTAPAAPTPAPRPAPADDWRKKVQDKIEEAKAKHDEKKAPPQFESAGVSATPTVDVQTEEEASDLVGSVKEVFLGGDGEAISKYKDLLHPADQRQNLLRLSAAPGLMYVDASSRYWYRDYNSSGPSLGVGADIWLTPFMGFNMNYLTTLSSSIDSDPASGRTVLVDHRFTTTQLQFRKFSSISRRSPSFNFGFGYNEYQMIVPKNEAERIRLRSSGPILSFTARRPTSANDARFFGVELYPKLSIKEERTAIKVKSGSSVTAYAVRFLFGTEYGFDRNNQVFWRLSHRFEQAVYEGAASVNDPVTGTAPEGVSVRTGTTLFEIGYSWGD